MSANPAPEPQSSGKAPQGRQSKTLEQIVREEAPDVFNSIPQDKRLQLARVSFARYEERVSVRTGPLPDPSELAAYNQIIPNGADRIMKMAEDQSAHRIQLEKTVVGSQQRQASRGQVFGLIIGLSGLSLATYAAVHGQPVFGTAIGGTTLVSLASVFVYSRYKQKEELASKAQQTQRDKLETRPKTAKKQS